MNDRAARWRLGVILLFALALAWGISWPVMKIALAEIPPWTFRAMGGTGGAAGLLFLSLLSKQPLRIARNHLPALVAVALLNFTVWQICVAYGLTMMGAGHAVVLAYTMPLWAVVFGATFLGERLNLRRVIALALGMAGIAVLLSADLEELGIAPMGLVFIAASAISWAAGTVFLKRHQWTISVLSLTTWLVIVGTVPMIPIAVLIEGDPFPDASFQAYLAVAYSAVFAFVFAYYAWFKVVSIFPVSMASIGTLMVPVGRRFQRRTRARRIPGLA